MKVQDILHALDTAFPFAAAESWDNSGLLVGDPSADAARVFVAVDATDAVLAQAIGTGAQLLVTHHPLLFRPVNSVLESDFIGRRVLRMARSGMSYIAAHTNYDNCRMGMLAAERMQLTAAVPLLPRETGGDGAGQEHRGMGCVGELPQALTLSAFAGYLRERFSLPSVEIYGDPDQNVRRVAVLPGSGRQEYSAALAQGADVYVTGDMDHHSGIDALAQGMAVIDAGHYGMEQIFVPDVAALLRERFPELTVLEEECRPPQWYSHE